MQQETIIRGDVVLTSGVLRDAYLVIRDGRIHDIGETSTVAPTADYSGHYLAPGYIDLHTHGIAGFDAMDGSPAAIAGMAKAALRHGVTSFLPTTVTQSLAATEQAIAAVRATREDQRRRRPDDQAQVLGIHLEGPWISLQAKGAQNGDFIVEPTRDSVLRLLEAGRDLVRLVTIAPEAEGFSAALAEFQQRNIVASMAHTVATYEQADAAMTAGVKRVTHCFNAMTGLHHRKPGVVGAALLRDDVTTELIADGVHVHPAVMQLMAKIKGPAGLMLVTDSIAAADMPERDDYELGGLRVAVCDGQARLADGSLAGSILTMDTAVRNMVNWCGIPLHDAVTMASTTPAKSIGCGDVKGQLVPGYDADIVVLTNHLRPLCTWLSHRD